MLKFKLRASKIILLLFLISAIIGGMFSVPSLGAGRTIKIMPVGDSCTEGMGDPDMGGYRTELYRLYTEAGLSIDYVGSNKRGPNSLPDKDNEGHSGWTIPQIASNIDNWLNTYNPDVVLLWIGGNDVLQGRVNTEGLSNLIDQIFRTKPNVTLFVADYYPWPEQIKQYNATIPGVVQQKANQGKKVYFVKLSDVQFSPNVDLSSDGLHLNVNGYSKIARIWFNSTINILREMAGTSPSQPTQPTQPTPTPTPGNNFPFPIPGDFPFPWFGSPTPAPNVPTPTPYVPMPGTGKTIKIMPVGDSCTEGMGDPDMGGYRTELYRLYTEAGLSIDFVGSNKRGPNSLPDKDNEGHSGWTIPQIASNIDNWLNTYNPDVVLLWIGGNDVLLGGNVNTTGLSNLIDQIFRTKPNITLFVADYYPWPEQIKQYNATIPGVVQQKANQGKKVYFVKLSDVQFSPNVDLSSDGLHLNVNGYSKIARIWFNSTVNILKEMAGSTPSQPTPTPPSYVVKGDINGDGDVNSIDYGLLKRYLIGLDSTLPNSNSYAAADLNNDNEINSLDFAYLKQILLGIRK